ncbi:MAG: serine protease [Chloroflexota bacterium]
MKKTILKVIKPFVIVVLAVFSLIAYGRLATVALAQGELPPPVEIVGGGVATPGEWPWQVALVDGATTGPNYWYSQFCGGSLVDRYWVVTSASCVTTASGGTMSPADVDVVAGIYDLLNPVAGYQQRNVVQIIRHPNFDTESSDFDIAMLRLEQPVTLGGAGETATAVAPLVPASIGDLSGTNAWATGWGNTESTPLFPTDLYEVQVPVIANAVCDDADHYDGQITNNMLCAGLDAGGKDFCEGDSGGPLVVQDGGVWKLAGVASWGEGCAEPDRPGVYTRVSLFVDWINSKIGLPGISMPDIPIGNIGITVTPTYRWNEVTEGAATWYYLWINDSKGKAIFKRWYQSTSICAGGVCQVTPNMVLGNDTYTWWVQTWNASGYGPWSNPKSFTVEVTAPAAPVTVGPSGAIGDDYYPEYVWNEVPLATWYYLWVDGPSGEVTRKWYQAKDVCNAGTCSVQPDTALLGGAYSWWVQSWNTAGATWSLKKEFTTTIPVIPVSLPVLNTPLGNTTDRTPTYQWTEVDESGRTESAATWYYLWVDGPNNVAMVRAWYKAVDVCDSVNCEITPNKFLGVGDHNWWVQAWNQAGGRWSAKGSFTVQTVDSFDSEFNGSYANWEAHSGAWAIKDNTFSTTGIFNAWATASYMTEYTGNVDYQARLARTGCAYCANSLIIRGSPTPAGADNEWANAYVFNYSTDGRYSVWKWVKTAMIPLKSWTTTSTVKKGSAWNTLRVITDDDKLYFYINETLVWSGTDTTLTQGRVGIGMYSENIPNERLWVDWATLSVFQ